MRVIEDPFIGKTPKGDVPMTNIIAKFPGKSGHAIAVTGHFDTKLFPGRKFVGANDGGSSTGLLLELVPATLADAQHADDIYVVFFDGEEAMGEWTDTDSVYGSRHLAYKWKADGTLAQLKALINVDMIGDKSLDVLIEENSTVRCASWYGTRRQNWVIKNIFWTKAKGRRRSYAFPKARRAIARHHRLQLRSLA